jgi:hypothetical protein
MSEPTKEEFYGMRFYPGQQLEKLCFHGEDAGFIEVGQYGVTEIEVVFESAQLGFVPWAVVTCEGRFLWKYNLAFVESVKYKEKQTG